MFRYVIYLIIDQFDTRRPKGVCGGHKVPASPAAQGNRARLYLRIPPSKKHMIWLTVYDERRAIRDVKRGEVSPSRNTGTFQTVFDSHF